MIPGIVASSRRAESAPQEFDPHWDNVVALLNFQGVTGSQVFTDSSGTREWSAHGNVQIDESRGYPEGRFPGGANDFLSTPASASLILTGDFTIELVICPLAMRTSGILSNNYPTFIQSDAFAVVLDHNDSRGAISVWHRRSSVAQLLYGPPLNLGEDYHIEINRSGGILRFFQNGILASTAASQEPFSLGSVQTRVGRYWNGSFDGRIRAIRITNGVCRNTSDFNPPPTPFPNVGPPL